VLASGVVALALGGRPITCGIDHVFGGIRLHYLIDFAAWSLICFIR